MYDLNNALANYRFTWLAEAAKAKAELDRLEQEKARTLASYVVPAGHWDAKPGDHAGAQVTYSQNRAIHEEQAQAARYQYDAQIRGARSRYQQFAAKAQVAGEGYLLITTDEARTPGWNSSEVVREAQKGGRIVFRDVEDFELAPAPASA